MSKLGQKKFLDFLVTKVRTRCITLARVYSMSMAVTLHRAS